MVVGAFPAAKLGALLLKQISKPIANVLKEQAKSSPLFRKYICMPPAQFYNWCEVQTKMWILNLGKPVNIPVLNEAMAIELGANLLGEAIIFIIAAGILISEYARSSRKEAAKEQDKVDEMQRLQSTLIELYMQTERQATQIKELNRYVYELDSRVVKKPWIQSGKEPIDSELPPILPIIPIMDSGLIDEGGKENATNDHKKSTQQPPGKPPPSSPPPSTPVIPQDVLPSESSSNTSKGDKLKNKINQDGQPNVIGRPNNVVTTALRDLQQQFFGGDGKDNNRPTLIQEALNHLLL